MNTDDNNPIIITNIKECIKQEISDDVKQTLAIFYLSVWNDLNTDETFQGSNNIGKIGILESKAQVKILREKPPGIDENMIVKAEIKEIIKTIEKNIPKEEENPRRLVSVDYEIKDRTLSHEFDLEKLQERVQDTFWAFYPKNAQDYTGPYFCFIQSSGMGKTKLLHTFCQLTGLKVLDADLECKLVLCRGMDPDMDPNTDPDMDPDMDPNKNCATENIFDHMLDFRDVLDTKKSPSDNADEIIHYLNTTLLKGKSSAKNLCVCFDEAQLLLPFKYGQYEAFIFRCVRLWLRVVRNNLKIVAIFTGTNTNLSNFEHFDEMIVQQTPSRDLGKNLTFYTKGPNKFSPFFQTTTIGCIRHEGSNATKSSNEFEKAVMFGRPLFAIMSLNGHLNHDKLTVVLKRMLFLEPKDQKWIDQNGDLSEKSNPNLACWNILGTRVQMGQTSILIASKLIARAYANLTGVYGGTAQICYMTDPVCARFAMCLMNKSWFWRIGRTGNGIAGREKKWWVQQMQIIFQKGLCRPEKGDTGEIMIALYLLFCGDDLRFEKNNEYLEFSVSLLDWLHLVIGGGKYRYERSSTHGVATRTSNKKQKTKQHPSVAQSLSINFIQVCRNYIRSYDKSWKSLEDQSFLEYLYNSATACYMFAGCNLIDMVASIRLKENNQQWTYCPLLMSFKSRSSFSPGEASEELEKMEKKAEKSNINRALCLLILFSLETQSNYDADSKLNHENLEAAIGELATGAIVSKIVCIPDDDIYGLTNSFWGVASPEEEYSEILASHAFINGHVGGNDASVDDDPLDARPLIARNALRSRSKMCPSWNGLVTALKPKKNEGAVAMDVDE